MSFRVVPGAERLFERENIDMRQRIQQAIGLFSTLLGGLGLAVGIQAAEKHTTATPGEIRQQIADGDAVLFDVREQAEWDAGHLADAAFVPLSALSQDPPDPRLVERVRKLVGRRSVVYCHCRSGIRAISAAEVLRKLGYDARAVKPGYQQLLQAGFAPAE